MGSYYLFIPKSSCQLARDVLRQEHMLEKGPSLEREETVGIPVHCKDVCHLTQLVKGKLGISEFEITPKLSPGTGRHTKKDGKVHQDLRELCIKSISTHPDFNESLLQEIPKNWEHHDDLVLFPETSFKSEAWLNNMDFWESVAKLLGSQRLAKKSSTIQDNDFRSPKVQLLLGGENVWVSRKENGIVYTWDITRSMFSAGNITEKMRVSKFDCKDQIIVDLFAGIGYFTLPYLVHAKAKHVHACEWNPAAIEALKANLKLNKVEDRCTIYVGDNRLTCPRDIADHVNMGLLPTAKISYKTACAALKSKTGGILHVHGNVRSGKNLTEIDPRIRKNVLLSKDFNCKNPSWKKWSLETANELSEIFLELYPGVESWTLTLLHLEDVKSFAPHVNHLVLDIQCAPVDLIN